MIIYGILWTYGFKNPGLSMIVYDNLWFLDEAGGFKPRLTTPDNEGFPLVNTGFP